MLVNMRKLFIILFIILATIFILINTIDFKVEMPEEYFSKHYALGWTDFDVKCIVIDKYKDSEHHNNPTVVGKDSLNKIYEFYFQTNDTSFYNYVEIGDIIESNKHSLSAAVIRSDSISKLFNFSNPK